MLALVLKWDVFNVLECCKMVAKEFGRKNEKGSEERNSVVEGPEDCSLGAMCFVRASSGGDRR